MIKSNLTELGHQPSNVQVLVSSAECHWMREEEFMSIPAELEGEEPCKKLVESEGGGSDHNKSIDEKLEGRAEGGNS